MLLRFRVQNFLSFNETSEFSMLAGKTRKFSDQVIKTKDLSLVKAGIIYGANASGKSNLIKAIHFSKDIILGGVGRVSVLNKNFRLAKDNKNISTFEYEIAIDKKYYAYGFVIDLKRKIIIEEWLYELRKDKEIKIYERDVMSNRIITTLDFKNKDDSNRFKIYSDDIKNQKNILLLSDIANKNIKNIKEFEVFNKVFKWFKEKLIIIYPESTFAGINFIDTDRELKSLYSNMLKYFDTGIDDITSIKTSFEDLIKKHPNMFSAEIEKAVYDKNIVLVNLDRNLYTIYRTKNDKLEAIKLGIKHNISEDKFEIFDFCDESDGTRRLFDLIPIINCLDGNNRIFIIDEIDRSLHPNLTYSFIKLFLSVQNNSSQIIVTTHDSNLLDQNLLRRDEIWFIEKTDGKSSFIYSLDKYQERFDKEIRRAYLNGRYGAIPKFKTSYFNKLGIDKWEE